jgi:hypothetical protein
MRSMFKQTMKKQLENEDNAMLEAKLIVSSCTDLHIWTSYGVNIDSYVTEVLKHKIYCSSLGQM